MFFLLILKKKMNTIVKTKTNYLLLINIISITAIPAIYKYSFLSFGGISPGVISLLLS